MLNSQLLKPNRKNNKNTENELLMLLIDPKPNFLKKIKKLIHIVRGK